MRGVLHGKSLKLAMPPQIPAKLLSLKQAPLTVKILFLKILNLIFYIFVSSNFIVFH